MQRPPLFLRMLALALSLAVACGGPAATAPAPPAAATSEAPGPVTTTLRAGTSGDYPPWSTWKDGHAEGFAAALLGAFAAERRIDLAWTRFRWPDLDGDLRAGRFDLAADGITVRPERSVAGRFTVPIARGGAVLLLRRPSWAPPPSAPPAGEGAALAQLRALDRPELSVGVNRGGHLERVARRLFTRARVVAFAENASVPEALARGEVSAVMTNTFEAPRWASGLDHVEILGPLTRDTVALYLRADQPDLAARLDDWLLAAEENGTLGAWRARLLGPGGGGATASPLDALLCATAERLALMPLVAAAKQRARSPVQDPAQEARVAEATRALVARAAKGRGLPPPPLEVVDAFFRAQVEAAKIVQQRAPPDAGTPAFSLKDDLRPAIARISARMAFLLVRLPRELTLAAVTAKARDELAESGLGDEDIARLAAPIAALGQ